MDGRAPELRHAELCAPDGDLDRDRRRDRAAGGRAPISFIDARDVARAAAAVLTGDAVTDGRVYSLTGPQALTFERAAQTFAAGA